jgi:membrane protein YqaA with SNARE-associated domain
MPDADDAALSSDGADLQERPGIVRRIYDWTIRWAESPHAQWALFALAFAEASFFPIPPDVLLIAMALARPKRALRYAAICLAGSVCGAVLGYYIGRFGMDAIGYPLLETYGATDAFNEVKAGFAENAFLWIFLAAFTIIPYKVFTIAAGTAYPDVTLGVLIGASILGRGLRFFALAGLLRIFGKKIERFIERYFNLCTIAFCVLAVLGFLCMHFLFDGDEAGHVEGSTPAGVNAPAPE